ncbi:ribonuclease H-like domain-containing protein [Tanacetum coccineum]
MGLVVDPDNHHLTSVIRVLMEVTKVTVFLFELLVIYISALDLKCNGWSLAVSKLMHKGAVACKEDEKYKGTMNELEAVDVLFLKILRIGGIEQTPNVMQIMLCRLEDMLAKMQKIESCLQYFFIVLYLAYGILSCYTIRLIGNDNTQLSDIDADETCSPVVKPATIWTILSLDISRHWLVY